MATSDDNICNICCEEFNQSIRAQIDCPSCHYPVCRTCVRTYLLGTNDDPHCLKCKHRWERDMLVKATLNSFVNGAYKDHRKNALFEHEKSRLPDTMPAVENFKICEKLEQKTCVLKEEIRQLRIKERVLIDKQGTIYQEIRQRRTGGAGKEKRKFMKSCPAPDCRGFLSTQWKCGLCDTLACSKCFCIKLTDDNGDVLDHNCREDDIKSADMIKKETRSCPSCAANIYKIEGCDQMWCTQCHTPFSWRTGLKVSGVVHNPHFYAWQNAGGAAALANAPGAVMCGGVPQLYQFRTVVLWALGVSSVRFRRNLVGDDEYTEPEVMARNIIHLHRACNHFALVELDRVRRICNGARDNEQLRIKYILKQIDEHDMKREIIRRDKKRNKAQAMLQIYELVNTVFTESLRDISVSLSEKRARFGEGDDDDDDEETAVEIIERNLQRCEALRDYANTELAKISVIYSQCVAFIEKDFMTTSRKYKKSDLIV